MIPMKVIIMCGGKGTRLREETAVKPKPMVEIGGRPILWHIMKIYDRFGYKDFIPMFTAPKFQPEEWVKLFTTSSTRIIPLI